ncbi:MAG: hypothetical protein KF760_26705 [Candidatus Eremiobacteraeota bacterium]|nr:hypothetical protein [Candidatus Eremiobacteraeota bacterium]MCW5868825.1 hypothetical protein [Candidatus Eremiobacteraeota bacterium]
MRNLAALLLLTLPALAQSRAEISQAAYRERSAGHYLKAWNLLLEGVRKFPDLRSEVSQFAPFVGAYREAILYNDPVQPNSHRPAADLTGLRQRDALDVIAEEAQKHQIVILNEAHYSSQSRAFAQLVAERLKFPLLAAETFSGDIFAIHEYGYPNRRAGYYLIDPFFADFVRRSFQLGYRPINYEQEESPPNQSVDESINSREEAQANHLMDRVLKRHPGQKLLIYVGYSHATESGRLEWMAARLARKSGLDPLTIDQTTLVEHSHPDNEYPAYKALRANLEKPIILEDDQQKHPVYGPYEGQVDLQVAHPPSREVNGRPQWMRLNGYRQDVPVKPEWLPQKGTALLQAYQEDETVNPIALDRLLVQAGTPAAVLLLPPGRYRLTRQDSEGREEALERLDII